MDEDTTTRDDFAPEPPAPLPPGPSLAARAGAFLEVVLVSGVPTQLVIMVLLKALGLPQTDADGQLARPFVFALLLTDAVVVLTLVAVFMRAGRDSWREVMLGWRPQRREVMLGVACVPLAFAVVGVVLAIVRAAWPELHNVPTNPFEALVRTRSDAILLSALAVLSGGVKEEVQRAFVLHRFGRFLGGERVGLVLFSLAFGAGHFMQGWDVGLATTLLGVFWGVLYLWRRSTVASVVSHSGFNVAQIVQFLVVGS